MRGEPELEAPRGSRRELPRGVVQVSDPLLTPGAVVGEKYRIEAWMGRGATADVFSAVHCLIGRRVAIKAQRVDDLARARSRTRFEREARSTGGVRSPHVGSVEDVGYLEDGRLYMVMQLYTGTTLEGLLAEGPLAPAAAVDLAGQLLEGLAAVHEAGLVHRDVKPGNVLLEHRSVGGMYAVLVDFGIAKPLRWPDGDLRVTQDGEFVGTPEYMAPEQIRGDADLDARVDIYAVGAVLFESLTGRPPFQGDCMIDVMSAALRDRLPPPSRYRAGLPRSLDQVVLKAMAADPAQRYASAAALQAALEAVVAQQGWPKQGAAWGTVDAQRPARLWLQPKDRIDSAATLGVRRRRAWVTGFSVTLVLLGSLMAVAQYGPWRYLFE